MNFKVVRMEEIHYKLLKALQANPDLSQRDLARGAGISLGKANYCLRALIEKGWVKAANFRHSTNKVAYAYLLTPHGIEEKTRATAYFLRRKVAEYEELEKEIEQLRSEVKRGLIQSNVLNDGLEENP
jgi:EPS-associated MarR family transcriptional regulator